MWQASSRQIWQVSCREMWISFIVLMWRTEWETDRETDRQVPELSDSLNRPQQRYLLHCFWTFSFKAQWKIKMNRPAEMMKICLQFLENSLSHILIFVPFLMNPKWSERMEVTAYTAWLDTGHTGQTNKQSANIKADTKGIMSEYVLFVFPWNLFVCVFPVRFKSIKYIFLLHYFLHVTWTTYF